MNVLQQVDPEVAAAIRGEERRQAETIELIASENYASAAVLEAQGSVLTNKYAEGLPAKRYYGGCEFVDQTEQLAIDRVKQIFQAEHANVQPHSGAQANMAAYFAFLTFGDTIMGMNLSHGGHLTHGSPVNFSGKFYHVVPYGVSKETEQIDYDEVARIALECRPKMIVTGASAYPRTIDFARFREIADSVGALLLADMAHIAGLVATGLHPSPVPYCHIVTSTTHKTLRGPRGGFILCPAEQAAAIDKAVFPLVQGGPLEHVIAAKAVAFGEALQPGFAAYQRQVVENAQALAESLQQEGLRVVSGGTDNHLMLVDVTVMGLTGRQVEKGLDAVGITVNKNAIPFDPHPPMRAGGIRLGTPASTTRGFGTDEMRTIARWIGQVVSSLEDEELRARIRGEVLELCRQYPVPGIPSRAGV